MSRLRIFNTFVFLSLLSGIALAWHSPSALAAEPLRVKVMSFNIRCANSGDGINQWDQRRDWAADLVRRSNSDFVGMQEVTSTQRADLDRLLPDYQVLSLSRESDPKNGEAMSLYYRADRWKIDPDQQGHFWLSDTPDQPGSVTWGNACPRMVTWARFIEKSSGRAIYVYNTHFDHQSEPARQKSAAMIADRIAKRDRQEPAVMMGDLNSGEGSVAIHTLTDKASSTIALIDTFRAVHPDAADVGTFHAFTGVPAEEGKIDFILVTPGVKALSAEIIREHLKSPDSKELSSEPIQANRGERYPSDHFPISAEIEIP
jgi:endonuclease/exonuclease/phosphatase family metal-dependent hydrolase